MQSTTKETAASGRLTELQQSIAKVVKGKEDVIQLALVALLAASFAINAPFYRVALILQLVFYALSVLALSRMLKSGILARVADAAGTFVLLNGAAVVALANFVGGRRAALTR